MWRSWRWDGTTVDEREPVRKSIERDFANDVLDVRIEPMKAGQILQYELKGVTYRPNLEPLGNLVVEFERTGDRVQATSTSYLFGKKDGTFMIATAAAVVNPGAAKKK